MAIRTLDDVIEEILDVSGIYGAHGSGDPGDDDAECPGQLKKMCRMCASAYLHDAITESAEIEAIIARGRRNF
jgi:hypothetical protein